MVEVIGDLTYTRINRLHNKPIVRMYLLASGGYHIIYIIYSKETSILYVK